MPKPLEVGLGGFRRAVIDAVSVAGMIEMAGLRKTPETSQRRF